MLDLIGCHTHEPYAQCLDQLLTLLVCFALRFVNRAVYLNRQPLLVPYFTQVRDNKGRIRTVPVTPFQRFGPPIWMADAPGLAIDRMTPRSDLYQSCLQAKGYRLVEDEPTAAPAAPTLE